MSVIKIEENIVGYKVDKKEPVAVVEPVHMHEAVKRPDKLIGSTYKLKTPEHVSDHAMYITINDIILNEGTAHEAMRPFEVFINSKNMDHFQWIVALTRIMSAVFRKGGDVTFLVEELRSVFDPRGGYWNKGRLQNSLVAEIGDVIEEHLIGIGMLSGPETDEVREAFMKKKSEEFLEKTDDSIDEVSGYPKTASLCSKCSQKSVVLLDGCATCLGCGLSSC